jgi:hypothetical protein
MATRLKLMQNACMALKQAPLLTVTDDVAIRYDLDIVYDDSIQGCLEEGYWNFAMRTVSIDH